MKTEPLDVTDYLASPERAISLLNTVIASGGDLAAIKVGVVAKALERAGLGETRIGPAFRTNAGPPSGALTCTPTSHHRRRPSDGNAAGC
jgi:hypothetical protein